jgi:pimeloyl-ACP methyl ester carboxylesterase
MPYAAHGSTRIHYEIAGAGPSLLLIPGLGASIRDMRALVRGLAAHATVVTLDNRGVGESDKPDEPYPMETLAADAVAVLDDAGVERAVVLGYSLGGRIALQLTLDHPERVERLVLLATGARVIPTWQRNLLFALLPHLPIGPRPRQPIYAFKRQRVASESYDGRDRLGEIRVPTLVVHGRSDTTAPPELGVELQEGIPGSRLEWYDGGHIAPISHRSGAVVEAVRRFLAEGV